MKLRRLRGLIVVGSLITLAAVETAVERRRTAAPLPRQAPPPASILPLDHVRMRQDLMTLCSPAFEGRRTGTEGGRKARAFVAERFREIGLEPIVPGYFQPFEFDHRSVKALFRRDRPFKLRFGDAANVLGAVRGQSLPDRWIVLSAHFDHLGVRDGVMHPGADDNASGVSALLAVAEWLKRNPPAHSILFAAFDSEELGLRGAKAFVAAPPVPLDRIALDVNLDMIGRNDSNTIWVAGTHHTPRLRPIVEEAARGAGIDVKLGHDRPMYRTGMVEDWTQSSDHGPFHDHGIPFLYLGVEDHDDYHQPTDTPDRIPPAFHAAAADLVLALVREADIRLDAR
jgi:hypothetical protein